jgi:hypothetical protein
VIYVLQLRARTTRAQSIPDRPFVSAPRAVHRLVGRVRAKTASAFHSQSRHISITPCDPRCEYCGGAPWLLGAEARLGRARSEAANETTLSGDYRPWLPGASRPCGIVRGCGRPRCKLAVLLGRFCVVEGKGGVVAPSAMHSLPLYP